MRPMILTTVLLSACLDLAALQQPGSTRDASAGPMPDGNILPGIDAAASTDAAPSSGCAGAGLHLGDGVWACPGAWSANGPDQRCAATHATCTLGFRNIDSCRAVSGGVFIGRRLYSQASAIPPLDNSTSSLSWGPDDGNTRHRAIFYCGPTTGPNTFPTAAANGFFQQIASCDKMPGSKAWRCPYQTGSDSDFDLVTNSDASNGVLCCPR